MNSGEWKNDPRLAAMDPVKLQYIEKIAAQISSQSKAELFPALLSPDEKKKIEMLHFLAKKLAARSS